MQYFLGAIASALLFGAVITLVSVLLRMLSALLFDFLLPFAGQTFLFGITGVAFAQWSLAREFRHQIAENRLTSILGNSLHLVLDGRALGFEIDLSELRSTLRKSQFAATVVILGVIVVLATFLCLGAMDGNPAAWAPGIPLVYVPALIAACGIVLFTTIEWPGTQAVSVITEQHLAGVFERINGRSGADLERLRTAETVVQSQAASLSINLNCDYATALLRQFTPEELDREQPEYVFAQALADVIANVESDCIGLSRVVENRNQLKQLIHIADQALLSNPAPLLRQRLESNAALLDSGEIRDLLESRQWDDYSRRLRRVHHELDGILGNISGEGSHKHRQERRDSRSDRADQTGPTTLNEAYEVLNVPPTATDAAIKSMFRALSKNWHPDATGQEDGRRMQRINQAYDLICTARGL